MTHGDARTTGTPATFLGSALGRGKSENPHTGHAPCREAENPSAGSTQSDQKGYGVRSHIARSTRTGPSAPMCGIVKRDWKWIVRWPQLSRRSDRRWHPPQECCNV